MHLFKSVLITGCSGVIGQGLARILDVTGSANQVVGCDPSEDHPGTRVYDACACSRPPEAPDYVDSIRAIATRYSADLVIPMSEASIWRFAQDGITELDGVPLLLPNRNAIEIGHDKLRSARHLEAVGLTAPWTQLVGDGPPPVVPCVLKMRVGSEGEYFVRIPDQELADYYASRRPDDIWQELLLPDDQEFTCGLYRTRGGEVRVIALHRTLRAGVTASAKLVDNAEIRRYLVDLAESLELRGSINVQLRVTDRGPVAFEINPRFSSSVVLRHLLGFQDFLWALREARGLEAGPYRLSPPGSRVYHGLRGYVLSAEAAGRRRSARPLALPSNPVIQ